MATIPLPQFPPDFKPRCYKCNSLTLHFNFTRHPWAWNQTEIQFSCGMCGAAGYGENTVIAKFSQQLKDWQQSKDQQAHLNEIAQERERERAREEADRRSREEAETRLRREAERARREEEAAESQRSAILAADLKRQAAERAAALAESEERRKIEAVERRRARDRERKARIREERRAAKAAAEAAREAASLASETISAEPTPTEEKIAQPPVDKAALRLATLERRRRLDREYRARIRAAARASASGTPLPQPSLPTPAPPEVASVVEAPPPPKKEEGDCAWRDCDKPRSSTSKYCSRTCSNKNAAWNAKHRGNQ